jgi:hypothetical protein
MAIYQGYGPNAGRSGGDPRGRTQNQSQYQQQRYENQQGPFANELARQFGRGAETDYQNYGDIMKRYGDVAGGGGPKNERIGYTDPFESYGGYREFSQTGGYSPTDISNMRARGVSPIRSAYANAQRNVGRQRSLQGGYSPNAVATQARMAREQGQSMADATQNVEAGLAEARNKGRLAGLGGMSDIEKQRLAAQIDVGKFNATQGNEDNLNQLRALQGMTSLYGTTPGMAQLFGNQLNTSIGQGGQFGLDLYGQDIASQQLPGQWDQNMGRAGDISDIYGAASTAIYPWLRNRQPSSGIGTNYGANSGITPLEQFNQNRPSQPSQYPASAGYTPLEQFPQQQPFMGPRRR